MTSVARPEPCPGHSVRRWFAQGWNVDQLAGLRALFSSTAGLPAGTGDGRGWTASARCWVLRDRAIVRSTPHGLPDTGARTFAPGSGRGPASVERLLALCGCWLLTSRGAFEHATTWGRPARTLRTAQWTRASNL